MQHPDRSLQFINLMVPLSALCFAGLAFLAFFHALVMKAVYPHFGPTMQAYSPLLAGFWAVGIVAAWNGERRLAPVLALGFFAAMGYGLYLLAGGASLLVVAAFFAMALAGEYALARLYLRSLPRQEEEEVLPGVRLRA